MYRASKPLWIAAVALSVACLSSTAWANDKITLMVGGVEKIIYLPAALAEQLGYYRDQNLDVDIQSEPVGVEAEDELLAGAVDGVVGFYDHSVDLQARGKFIESIVLIGQTPGEAILVPTRLAPDIRSPADFKGRALGVTGLGSSTDFLMQYLSIKHGVPVRNITLIPVGAGNTFITAMQQGRIDVGMTTEPTISRLLNSGAAHVLVDMRTPESTREALGGTYPAACLYVQSSWAQQHHDLAQRLTTALVRTLRFIDTHSAVEIADLMPAEYYAGDKAAYIKALRDGKARFTPDGRMPIDGPPTVLAVLSGFSKNLKGKAIDLSRTYTDSFVDAVK
ncbi:MAG TPA: ABC transporter substrate-binding protein [Aliidongia sp.]|uniref:ABC transporter substrate-binding protein n=1 Tax=Aliidongia sp. TaxID=1914230 RepID=UPI002DDCBB15|nr:ABC transporter substrate-binding protein [Aliidongia sp.]HEV2678390.1 ABC transporter substrate-binding protein [Aliidongia sp.]